MVAAFREDARDLQLPFQEWPQAQSASHADAPFAPISYTYDESAALVPVQTSGLKNGLANQSSRSSLDLPHVSPPQLGATSPASQARVAQSASSQQRATSSRAIPRTARATHPRPAQRTSQSASRHARYTASLGSPLIHSRSKATRSRANYAEPRPVPVQADVSAFPGEPIQTIAQHRSPFQPYSATTSQVQASQIQISSTPIPAGRRTRSLATVTPLPHQRPQASWLQWLALGQRSLCVVTLFLVGAALSLYSQSVYQQRQWGQAYNTLQHLQQQEQEGVAANELMKHSLAAEAEQSAGLEASQLPGSAMISIDKALPRETLVAPPATPTVDLDLDRVSGY